MPMFPLLSFGSTHSRSQPSCSPFPPWATPRLLQTAFSCAQTSLFSQSPPSSLLLTRTLCCTACPAGWGALFSLCKALAPHSWPPPTQMPSLPCLSSDTGSLAASAGKHSLFGLDRRALSHVDLFLSSLLRRNPSWAATVVQDSLCWVLPCATRLTASQSKLIRSEGEATENEKAEITCNFSSRFQTICHISQSCTCIICLVKRIHLRFCYRIFQK